MDSNRDRKVKLHALSLAVLRGSDLFEELQDIEANLTEGYTYGVGYLHSLCMSDAQRQLDSMKCHTEVLSQFS